jgi:hypothetical protein
MEAKRKRRGAALSHIAFDARGFHDACRGKRISVRCSRCLGCKNMREGGLGAQQIVRLLRKQR